MIITSKNNSKVIFWNKLKNKKYQNEYGLYLVEGDHLVNEAIKLNVVKEIITIDENKYNNDTYIVTKDIMDKLSSQVSSTNVIAVCYKKDNYEIDGNVLVLDNIQDPGNLGTLIRTCVSFNFNTIIISNNSVDYYNDKVIRSTEGAFFKINLIKGDLKEYINILYNMGYNVYSTNVNDGINVCNINKDNKIAVVLGNESVGVSKEINDLISNRIYIDINKKCESLNVAVAGSIIMYEINKGNL